MANIVKSIELDFKKDFPTFLIGEEIELDVIANYYDDVSYVSGVTNFSVVPSIPVTTESTCFVISLDDNFLIQNGVSSSGKKIVYARREGSGVIKAIYTSASGETHITAKQFVCHGNYFKTNYLDYLFSSFNKSKILSNNYVKSIFDTLMEMLDILYAFNEDLKVIGNFQNGKSSFLNLLSNNIGFNRIDLLEINTINESRSNEVFKDLLNNMLDLLSIRGTYLAYELFFKALGYNISIQEFWYDDDGYLVDINPLDSTKSTFFRYNKDGSFVDTPPVPVPDPRNKYIHGTSVYKNNKSNYIRVNIESSLSPLLAQDPNLFSAEKNLIIKRYLDFLRPSHVQYITETTVGAYIGDDISSFNSEVLFGEIKGLIKPSGSDGFFNDILNFINNEELIFGGSVSNPNDPFSVWNETLEYFNRWDTGFFDEGKWDNTKLFEEVVLFTKTI